MRRFAQLRRTPRFATGRRQKSRKTVPQLQVKFDVDFASELAFCVAMTTLLRRYKFLLLAACMVTGVTGCTTTDNYPYFGKEKQSSAPPRTSGISRGA